MVEVALDLMTDEQIIDLLYSTPTNHRFAKHGC
jgi:hypothetical protein